MDSLIQVLGLIGLILSIPAAAGTALALFRASYIKAQLEQVRGHNEDLRKRVADLESDNSNLHQENNKLGGQVVALTEAVTQRADLAAHHDAVQQFHRTLDSNYDSLAGIMGQILTTMQEVRDALAQQ